MKNFKYLLLIFSVVLALNACEKESEPTYIGPLQIRTDKDIYGVNDSVIVEVYNLTDTIVQHSYNWKYSVLPLTFLKYEGGSWDHYWTMVCSLYDCSCCKKINPGESKRDTLHKTFEVGIYRIEYFLGMGKPPFYRSFYSNIFIVE